MKIVLSQVLKFPFFLRECSNKEFSIQTAYKIFKIRQKTEEATKFYDENLQKIIRDYAIYDENGEIKRSEENGVLISKEKFEECTKKVQELNDCLIDFPETSFQLNDFDGIKISLEALEAIFPFIEEQKDHH